jgi:hypothetical protein
VIQAVPWVVVHELYCWIVSVSVFRVCESVFRGCAGAQEQEQLPGVDANADASELVGANRLHVQEDPMPWETHEAVAERNREEVERHREEDEHLNGAVAVDRQIGGEVLVLEQEPKLASMCLVEGDDDNDKNVVLGDVGGAGDGDTHDDRLDEEEGDTYGCVAVETDAD